MPPSDQPPFLLQAFTTLSDLARVRMLRLLEMQELSVGELGKALQLPQSTVSRHLKVLFGQGWVIKRAMGTASMYRFDAAGLDETSAKLWSLTSDGVEITPTLKGDDHRLAQVLADRGTSTRDFFESIGGQWEQVRDELFGHDFTAQALLGLVQPHLVVADIGCGTGTAAAQLAPFVDRVIAIDREPAMLDAARSGTSHIDNIQVKEGELGSLPLDDGSVDAVTLLLILHHVADLAGGLRDVSRVLKSGGQALVLDMVAHDRGAFRDTMGHQHLGFSRQAIADAAVAAGLTMGDYRRLPPDVEGRGPGLFVARLGKS